MICFSVGMQSFESSTVVDLITFCSKVRTKFLHNHIICNRLLCGTSHSWLSSGGGSHRRNTPVDRTADGYSGKYL